MLQVIQASSADSIDALTRAELIFLDMENSLVVPDSQAIGGESKWVSRPEVLGFLEQYGNKVGESHKKGLVVFSDWGRNQLENVIHTSGWEEYLRLVFGSDHLYRRSFYDAEGSRTRMSLIKVLGKAFGHFIPKIHNPVFIGVGSDLNKASCEEYRVTLLELPNEPTNKPLEDRFSFRSLYR
ncbi:MAG: hypothetical protein AABX70_01750 [Nanoarchaeota archaeon]